MATLNTKINVNIGNKKSVGVAITKTLLLKKDASGSSVDTRKYAERIRRRYLTPMMRELKNQTPPHRSYPQDYPIQYVSEKQRRFVMALLRGKPYKRTHGLSKGWYYRMRTSGSKISVTIGNRRNYAGYVIGKFGVGISKRQIKRYLKPMQPFHKKTGWKPAHKTVQKYLLNAQEDARAIAKYKFK